jgi:hypothetical protein
MQWMMIALLVIVALWFAGMGMGRQGGGCPYASTGGCGCGGGMPGAARPRSSEDLLTRM